MKNYNCKRIKLSFDCVYYVCNNNFLKSKSVNLVFSLLCLFLILSKNINFNYFIRKGLCFSQSRGLNLKTILSPSARPNHGGASLDTKLKLNPLTDWPLHNLLLAAAPVIDGFN